MKILVLSSVHPKFGHVKASYLALASLLEAFAQAGYATSWTTLSPINELDISTKSRLELLGICHLKNFSKKEIFFSPRTAAATLMRSQADVFILFWDTAFEYLLPYIKSIPVIGYFGSMPFRASMVRLKYFPYKGNINKIENWLRYKILQYREQRHLRRLQYITKASDISLFESKYYTNHGIPCSYIPNTFSDIFGPAWYDKRNVAESKRSKFGLLGNIGQLFGTGNFLGLSFLADEILPKLDDVLVDIDWEINICGQGKMDEGLRKKLTHSRVNIKGFIDNIDEEMLSNPILLVLNNIGPLVTGWTRIIYAFSSGSCVISHKDVYKSMPEIKHGVNALLGENADEILQLIREATHNKKLRAEIGKNARMTYEQNYHPKIIASKLINLIQR